MTNYIIRRIFWLIPAILFVSIITFLLCRWVPGSAVDVIQSELSLGGRVEVDPAVIRHMLGLDIPVWRQYINWIGDIILHWDFGNSIIQSRPVADLIAERLPVTLELGIMGLVIGQTLALPLGVLTAARQDSAIDYSLRVFSILLVALPQFWVATMVMIYPQVLFDWSPSIEFISFTKDPLGNLGMFVIPAFLMGITTMGMSLRFVRTMMLEVMRQDYIRTAWSKGITETVVVSRHAVKNAFIPVITMLGGQMATLFGGAVFIEQIFGLPGMGTLMLSALNNRDYPIIQSITIFMSVIVMFANLLVDISYTWLDPRIRYS